MFRQSLLIAAFLTSAVLLLTGAKAEIIIDDFDESFEIAMPDMEGQYVIQSNIGPLDAERWSQVNSTSASEPTGRADANLTHASAMTFQLDRLNPHPIGGPPSVSANLVYYFNEIDITENGFNDRIVVDFEFLKSAIPMAQVTVFAYDETQPGISYGLQLFNVMQREGSFSLEFPFALFAARGGGSPRIDFQRIYRLSVHLSPTHFNDIDQINFLTVVKRVRITSAVPEPNTRFFIMFSVYGFACFSARKRRWRDEEPGNFFIGRWSVVRPFEH